MADTQCLYGMNPAFEVLRAGRRRVFGAYLGRGAENAPRMRKLRALLESHGIPVRIEEKGRLIHLAGSREHQGVVLETEVYPYVPSDTLFARPRLVLLDNIEDPHNVGAIIRSAEAFGFAGVLLPKHGTPPVLPSVVKAAAGATEHVEIAADSSANQYARTALDTGYTVAALDGKGAVTIDALAAESYPKVLLVVGGEASGVGQFILNMATLVVRIAQHGRIGSLNASVAAGIALHALALPAAAGKAESGPRPSGSA